MVERGHLEGSLAKSSSWKHEFATVVKGYLFSAQVRGKISVFLSPIHQHPEFPSKTFLPKRMLL